MAEEKIRRLFDVFSEVHAIENVKHGREQRRGEHHQRVEAANENLRIVSRGAREVRENGGEVWRRFIERRRRREERLRRFRNVGGG